MRRKTGYAMACALAVVSVSSLMGMTAAAREKCDDVIAIPYEQENAWEDVAMTNDDTVSTGIFVRKTPDAEGEVLGYLYEGGAVWVVNKGEAWTEISFGEGSGFVKNEYLVYGDDVKGLAEYYGVNGVATTWDDVKLFPDGTGESASIEILKTGESFILIEDQGHWLEIQDIEDRDFMAYVSVEDVTPVLLFETAIPKDDENKGKHWLYDFDEDEDEYVEEENAEESYQAPQTEAPSYTPPQTEAPSYTPPQTEAPQTEAPQTEPPQTEAPADDGDDDDGVIDDGDGGYYDADTDTYYDADGNVISQPSYNAAAEETYVEETETYVEETEAYVEETYAEETYVEETEAYVEETEAASAGSDDTSLLAALIYCEAGNQSYEGMVAVGAVVMNRVYSSSFPNSISEVIYQSGQFTPASSGSLASALANGVPSTCYDAAVAAIGGENPVGSALYFNTGSGKGIKIGDHQFY
ncbi:MAG: cell wall hydrolase [Candidatus Choladocola sp.]|nr:cell wall hydrolase [Candidatus Choladocola sp.]